jgi:hypothetical protein
MPSRRDDSIDADDLLFGGVHAAGENAGLHRSQVFRRAHQGTCIDVPQARAQPLARFVVASETDNLRKRPQRGHVAGGIARPARHNLRRVVLKDEHGRLARHAGDAPVDELVGDQVANNGDTAPMEPVDELQQPGLGPAFIGRRLNGLLDGHTNK